MRRCAGDSATTSLYGLDRCVQHKLPHDASRSTERLDNVLTTLIADTSIGEGVYLVAKPPPARGRDGSEQVPTMPTASSPKSSGKLKVIDCTILLLKDPPRVPASNKRGITFEILAAFVGPANDLFVFIPSYAIAYTLITST